MSEVQRVLVVGGGIGGTALAIALGRQGTDVEIVERESTWEAKGTGISLMGPALRALQTLGLLDACVTEGFGVSAMKFFTASGDLIDSVEMSSLLGPEYPAISGMMRPDLHRILSVAAREQGTKVRLDTRVTSMQQLSGGVDVTFSNGDRATYDLVVGADGFRSEIRERLLGDKNPEPRFHGQVVWRAIVDRPAEVDDFFMFYGPQSKTGFSPLSREKMYIFLVEPDEQRARHQPDALASEMRSLLGDFGGIVADVRETITSPEQVDVRALDSLIVQLPWHKGRVVLIGDAAHTTTPQLAMGAAIALEDALVLAEVLAADNTVPEALAAFETRRFERCRMVVENSAQMAEWEKDAAAHGEESARLMEQSLIALAQPI